MKKIINVCLIMLLVSTYFVNLIPVKAESLTIYGYNNQSDNLAINRSAKTGDKVASLPIASSVRLVSTNKYGTNGCSSGWYQVYYEENKIGYVCSKNLTTYSVSSDYSTDASFASQLNAFPDSYKPFIKYLHSVYPNASFEAFNTGLDWNNSITEESYLKKNYIQITDNNKEGWKNPIDPNTIYEAPNWYAANVDMIKYFMDPRNFLNEKYVFQFEQLSYSSSHTEDGIKNMIASSFMDNQNIKDNNGNDVSYANAIFYAGKNNGISPYHLASRIIQEQGINGTGNSISGRVSGYEGYYNYYNIYSTASNGRTAVQNGLYYAQGYTNNSTSYGRPWNTPYKAINGGAEWIADGYINVGQDIIYSQKFDIVGPKYYSHQYMQNVQAAATEGGKAYNAYKKINNYKNISYKFKIPVYNNMPSKTYFASIFAGVSTNAGTNNSVSDNGQSSANSQSSSQNNVNSNIRYGDLNGDNEINAIDMLRVKKHILGVSVLSGNDLTAADVNKDGSVDSIDMLRIKKHILGIITIS